VTDIDRSLNDITTQIAKLGERVDDSMSGLRAEVHEIRVYLFGGEAQDERRALRDRVKDLESDVRNAESEIRDLRAEIKLLHIAERATVAPAERSRLVQALVFGGVGLTLVTVFAAALKIILGG